MDRSQFSAGAEEVLGYFYDISQIPRQSGNNDRMSDYLRKFGKDLGLPTSVDSAGNVMITKPASPGCEGAIPVTLEAHYDMVCEKAPDSRHDFQLPLELRRDGDRIFAEGTTLGADNGLGMAAIMAVLAGNMPHPPLEAIFTASEETDMAGARGLDISRLAGKLLLTLDSRALLCCGAGELEMEITLPVKTVEPPLDSRYCRLEVSGLRGGHTGSNAMDEPGNAIILLSRVLLEFKKAGVSFLLGGMRGGSGSPSAFAREARCILCLRPTQVQTAEKIASSLQTVFAQELRGRSDGIKVSLTTADPAETCFSSETAERLLRLLSLLPDGICTINHDFPGAMESSANCGFISTGAEEISLLVLIRSTCGSRKYVLMDKINILCSLTGAAWRICHDLPQWDQNVPQDILNIAREIYYEQEPQVSQGTLECGVFQAGRPDLYLLGVGLPYYYQHSPAEYALVSETALYWDKLKTFLAALSKKVTV